MPVGGFRIWGGEERLGQVRIGLKRLKEGCMHMKVTMEATMA